MKIHELKGTCIFVGDIHGRPLNVSKSHFEMNKTESIPHIILCGDIGFGFDSTDRLEEVLDTVFYHEAEIWLVRGNHDNPAFWYGKHEAIEKEFPRIHFVQDNDIMIINDKKYLVMGGGISIDQAYRTEGKSYWPDELVKEAEYDGEIYGIISHSGPCPPCLPPMDHPLIKYGSEKMRQQLNEERDLFERALVKYQPKVWIYGHYHVHDFYEREGCKFYNLNINEIITSNIL